MTKSRSLNSTPIVGIAVLAAAVLAGLPPAVRGVDLKTAQRIDAEIEKNRAEIVKIRRFIHMNPELGNREFETARLISAKLEPLGFESGPASPRRASWPSSGEASPARLSPSGRTWTPSPFRR